MGKIIDRVRRREARKGRPAVYRISDAGQPVVFAEVPPHVTFLGASLCDGTGRKVRDLVAERSTEVERMVMRCAKLAGGTKP